MIPHITLKDPDTRQLSNACREWGFFFLEDHRISRHLIEASLDASLAFFHQPLEVKNRIRRSETNSWGYYDAELTKNRRDWKQILDIGPGRTSGPMAGSTPQWPQLPGFRSTLSDLNDALHGVALDVVDLVVTTLGVTLNLDQVFHQHSSFMRLNYYPECANPAKDTLSLVPATGELGISHHTDAGAVTVLVQDGMPGLQVYNRGRWVDAGGTRGAIIINIGDIVQVLSNDAYIAPVHRVLAQANTTRTSIPYFLNPADDYNYAPFAEKPRYRPVNWGGFRAQRSAGDYADVGDEVQISDYRI